jgi:acyl-CoA synthetase (AMP-forming)/AMP-acid ligase II
MTTDDETGHQRSPWKAFATGDVGFCEREKNSDSEEPIWYVKGRKDDMEKIDGVWTSPSEVEMAFSNVYLMVDRVAATIVNKGVYATKLASHAT